MLATLIFFFFFFFAAAASENFCCPLPAPRPITNDQLSGVVLFLFFHQKVTKKIHQIGPKFRRDLRVYKQMST